jgi:hypothetical protein
MINKFKKSTKLEKKSRPYTSLVKIIKNTLQNDISDLSSWQKSWYLFQMGKNLIKW